MVLIKSVSYEICNGIMKRSFSGINNIFIPFWVFFCRGDQLGNDWTKISPINPLIFASAKNFNIIT